MSPKAPWYPVDYAWKSDLAASKLGLKVPETLGKKKKVAVKVSLCGAHPPKINLRRFLSVLLK